jgi:putative aminopeptidase FrvX
MAIPDLFRSLLTAPGPSGYETEAVAVWRQAAESFTSDVRVDVMGSCSARVPGTGDGPTLAVIGHIDEIGLIVRHIDDQGYLWCTEVGGWDPLILVGQRVEVLTRDGRIPGVIGRKAIHLLRKEEREKVPELRDLHIDIGAADADEARALVALGDVAVIDVEPLLLPHRRVVSRALDNRVGAYVALETARLVAEAGGAAGDVVAIAAAQEETMLAGAMTAVFGLDPDLAIVLDVTHASDVPGSDEKETGRHPLGSGPVIQRGSMLHPRIFELLRDAAEAEGIAYTVRAIGRRSGTDADAVALTRAGIPTSLVEVPLRYMHSPVEVIQLDDVEAVAQLLAAFARRLEPGVSFAR